MDRQPPKSEEPPPIESSSALGPDDPPVGVIALEEAEAAVDAEGAIRSGKLAGKSMWSAIWILALPVLLQQTMAACVGLVDKIIAGSLPEPIVVAALTRSASAPTWGGSSQSPWWVSGSGPRR